MTWRNLWPGDAIPADRGAHDNNGRIAKRPDLFTDGNTRLRQTRTGRNSEFSTDSKGYVPKPPAGIRRRSH